MDAFIDFDTYIDNHENYSKKHIKLFEDIRKYYSEYEITIEILTDDIFCHILCIDGIEFAIHSEYNRENIFIYETNAFGIKNISFDQIIENISRLFDMRAKIEDKIGDKIICNRENGGLIIYTDDKTYYIEIGYDYITLSESNKIMSLIFSKNIDDFICKLVPFIEKLENL